MIDLSSIDLHATRRFLGFGVGLAVLAVSGCRSQRVELDAAQSAVRRTLAQVHAGSDPLAARTPVIDVHTHTFNARYLPLRGILLGKRDAAPPFSWLLSDQCAKILAQAVADHTALAAAGGQPASERRISAASVAGRLKAGPVCRVFLKLLDKAAAAGCWDQRISLMDRRQRARTLAQSMTAAERVAVRTTMQMMGMDEHGSGAGRESSVVAAVEFLWTLTQSDGDLFRLFRDAHHGAPGPKPPAMVVHMIDLAPVYDQFPDGSALLDLERHQIRRMADFQRASGGTVEYFVAYNPFRDHWRGGKPGDSLKIVREAVDRHGAAGVKVYPPSGYRATANRIPARAGSLFSRYPERQWDARYAAYGPDGGRSLDRALEELLKWCRRRDLPVFVHSGHGEFEARKGYGRLHSDPVFWRRYLESHPEPDGSPCRLRLCFGHAGGADFWFGTGDLPDWGREVYEMCIRYPNVYCEVTAGADLTDPDRQALFASRLLERFAASENAGPAAFPFAGKILYGTDWYLPDRAEPADVLRAAQTVFLHPGLRRHYADYFQRNARRYLRRNL